jgi:hypothetical protein
MLHTQSLQQIPMKADDGVYKLGELSTCNKKRCDIVIADALFA